MDAKQRVKEIVEDVKSILNSTNDPQLFITSLEKLQELLPDFSDTGTASSNEAQMLFIRHHYVRFLYFLLEKINSVWETAWTREQHDVFDSFFLKGSLHDALIVLSRNISETKPSYKLTKSVNLLEELINPKNLTVMFINLCKVETKSGVEIKQPCWDDVITILVSLPERMANKLQKNNRSNFYPTKYFNNLSSTILVTLKTVNDSLRNERDCSLQFLCQLFGRCCLVGQADIILNNLIRRTVRDDNYIWRRICHRLVLDIPDRCLENMLSSLVRLIPRSKLMSHVLGDAVLKNSKIHLLLTQKFIFFRTFEDDKVLRNILGYFAEIDSKQELLLKVVSSLLTVWSDKIAITHSSYEQHAYITRALLVSFGLSKKDNLIIYKAEFLSKLLAGVNNHLQSPHERVRLIGMVTAECLTQRIDSESDPLKFEYKTNDETEKLKSLLNPSDDNDQDDDFDFDEVVDQFEKLDVGSASEMPTSSVSNANKNEDCDLDSDDDLEPYDMSSDTPTTKFKKPSYIRDCLEGLIDQSNPDRTEICLESAEQLIKDEVDLDSDLAIEIARVILYLENKTPLTLFSSLRHNSLVAVTVRCPAQVADYLCREFYDPNYSIRQRLDILEVLTAAAFELSLPISVKPAEKKIEQKPRDESDRVENWREIIEKRIEKKTKYFTKPQAMPTPSPNRFAPVAGHFFFPLMTRYDNKLNTFDLLGDDSLVLGRLLHTLGTIMYSAMNAPIAPQMGKCLFDFLWALRYHVEPYIRKGVMFCICMIILSLPPHVLQNDLQEEFMECFLWLKDVISDDVNQECKHLAAQTLMLCRNTFSDLSQ